MDSRVFLKICVLFAAVALFSGCGGDSSSSNTPTPTTPTTPTTPSTTGVVSQIVFTSADPTAIAINGVGMRSTSTLTFTVVDDTGGTISGATVNFALNTSVGGITLSNSSATSDSAGLVTTTVSAGDVPTAVVVTATLASDTTIFAYSNQLTISTGHADQDSFSLSASVFNPEGGGHDGEVVTLTVYASDHSSNPVPDGETVYFHAEGGQIEPACALASGSCSVVWRSANRRPFNDGRVTVTATMIGEEGFSDINGNGVLDDTDSFVDKAEVYYDYDESGTFNPLVMNLDQNLDPYYEEFLDFDGNLTHTAADGEYNGTKCNSANTVNICSTQTSMDVRESLVIVMSNSGAVITPSVGGLAIAGGVGASASASATVSDTHLIPQPMPAGTTITVAAPAGLTLTSNATYTYPSTNLAGTVTISITVTVAASPGAGDITITVTTPKGHETIATIPATW